MIRVANLRKSFGSLEILKGVDLTIGDAEVVSIVGSSGAGKTTLLTILGTLDRADSGSVIYGDTDISSLSEKKLASFRNRNIGFVFQFHQLLPEFTAIENVCIPAFIGRQPRAETVKRASALLDRLGVLSRASHKPSELSGGEQQRVAVARALINDPSVILADEPSGNLDSSNAAELHSLFFSLRDDFRKTFVIVTHNEQLASMADRVLVMKDGRMISQKPGG
jgi:lipoprotein-releasing system ATP-binding protein